MKEEDHAFQQQFLKEIRQICARPAMYAGRESFDLVAVFINGLVVGIHSTSGELPSLQDWGFQKFVLKKYGVGNALVWPSAYRMKIPDWEERSETEKLAVLVADYEEFANVLTRMAMEL